MFGVGVQCERRGEYKESDHLLLGGIRGAGKGEIVKCHFP